MVAGRELAPYKIFTFTPDKKPISHERRSKKNNEPS